MASADDDIPAGRVSDVDYGDDTTGWYDAWPALLTIYVAIVNTGGPTHYLLVFDTM